MDILAQSRIGWIGGDGRLPLLATAWSLIGSGLFALILGAMGRFLPHDEAYLGMTARDLCGLHGCRIVHFMMHDRVSFGGAVLGVGLVYWWLTEVPLRRGEPWAWWLLLISGVVGFASFFAYLGYGYLDTWHGLATLALLPCYAFGLIRSWPTLPAQGIECLRRPGCIQPWSTRAGIGRALLLATALGTFCAGLTIMTVGMTCVFVPQDLTFMDLHAAELHALNARLIPLIAHDRAGFGGAVACAGLTGFFSVWCGAPSRSLWWTLLLVGIAGFGSAIGVHPAIGYNDVVHLAPAALGGVGYTLGLALWAPSCQEAPR